MGGSHLRWWWSTVACTGAISIPNGWCRRGPPVLVEDADLLIKAVSQASGGRTGQNDTSFINVLLSGRGQCALAAHMPRRGSGRAWLAGEGHRRAGSGLLDQNGTGIEQVEALALRVLLGLRSWLGDDHGHVAASGRGVGEPGRQQRSEEHTS